MDEAIAAAREKLEKEYKDVMESLGDLYVAVEAVKSAGLEDNIADLLETVEEEAKNARTGGMLGSGANAHKRALKDLRELTHPS